MGRVEGREEEFRSDNGKTADQAVGGVRGRLFVARRCLRIGTAVARPLFSDGDECR